MERVGTDHYVEALRRKRHVLAVTGGEHRSVAVSGWRQLREGPRAHGRRVVQPDDRHGPADAQQHARERPRTGADVEQSKGAPVLRPPARNLLY